MTPGIGGKSVVKILTRLELRSMPPEDFFQLSVEVLQEEFNLTARQALSLSKASEYRSSLNSQVDELVRLGVTWVTLVDAHYPSLIEEFDPDPPGVLFLFGNTRLVDGRTFSVLSSRNTTIAGLDQISQLTEEAVLHGEILVSGHNTNEYQRSALVPLRYGAPRILALDRGLFPALGKNLTEELFPSARLWRFEFDSKTDLVITPFRPNAGFTGVNNKVRDRIIAGMSRRVDFIEVQPGGNMERLARMALKAGRPVRVSDRTLNARRFAESGANVLPA